MRLNPSRHRQLMAIGLVITTLIALLTLAVAANPAAAAKRCFGKSAKSISKPGTHRLGWNQAVILDAPVKIIAKGDARICSGRGGHPANITLGKGNRNLVKLGSGDDVVRVAGPTRLTRIDAGHGNNRVIVANKAMKHVVRTGNGNDTIQIRKRAKASKRVISTGLGNDRVVVRAKGNTNATLSSKSNPRGLPNSSFYAGGASNDIVEVYGGDNVIHGNNGSDRIRSLGTAASLIYGGNGTDYLYSNGNDFIYGGRGNDHIHANQGTSIGGVYADGGVGDDWLYGTDFDDVLVGATGIDKFRGYGGNDLFRVAGGANTVDGGPGVNTISFSSHTPPGYSNRSGVLIDLRAGEARGDGVTKMSGIRNVIGSSFDDVIRTHPARSSEIWGGLGDDEITAGPDDTVHPPSGGQPCRVSQQRQTHCPPPPDPRHHTSLGVSPDGVLTVLGSQHDDVISVSSAGQDSYRVNASRPFAGTVDGCTVRGGQATCNIPRLANVLVYGGAGGDAITIDDSVPAQVSTVLDGGPGNNTIRGGRTTDYISTGPGSSLLEGGAGDDVITTSDTGATRVNGGSGHDVIRVSNACAGHTISAGPGKDNVVFASSPRGVEVNFDKGYARWRNVGSCSQTRLSSDIESGEGSRYDDLFISSRKGGKSFLGRHGVDTFMVRNGKRDTVTVGDGGRRNKVTADRFDKITWGWGFAAY